MNFAHKSIVSSLAFISCIGLISCTSQDEIKREKRQFVEGDTIEVTGICEKEENYEPCPITNTNIPKYLRQSVALDQDYKYRKGSGKTPATINSFVILDHIDNGFLIDEYIGYKYIKGRGNPGYVSLATKQSEIHPNATIYEVFTNDFDTKLQQDLNLGKPVEVAKLNLSCYFHKYYRDNERVVVIIQAEQAHYTDFPEDERRSQLDEIRKMGLNCSVYGHLYYFGINPNQIQEDHGFYKFGNSISTEVIFNKQKIIKNLKEQE